MKITTKCNKKYCTKFFLKKSEEMVTLDIWTALLRWRQRKNCFIEDLCFKFRKMKKLLHTLIT